MFLAYRLACEIFPKCVVAQLRIDCECYVVSTWNGGRVIANEWYGEGGRGLFLNYYRNILQRGTYHYLDICLSEIQTWALSNFLYSGVLSATPFNLVWSYCCFFAKAVVICEMHLGIITDSVVCGWANNKCRGAMGNSVTFRLNTATDRSPLQ
jgi:hypothetical protein